MNMERELLKEVLEEIIYNMDIAIGKYHSLCIYLGNIKYKIYSDGYGTVIHIYGKNKYVPLYINHYATITESIARNYGCIDLFSTVYHKYREKLQKNLYLKSLGKLKESRHA